MFFAWTQVFNNFLEMIPIPVDVLYITLCSLCVRVGITSCLTPPIFITAFGFASLCLRGISSPFHPFVCQNSYDFNVTLSTKLTQGQGIVPSSYFCPKYHSLSLQFPSEQHFHFSQSIFTLTFISIRIELSLPFSKFSKIYLEIVSSSGGFPHPC